VIEKTAKLMADELREYPDLAESGEELEDDIAKAIHHACSTDGYKICRQLDFMGWDCDEELVDAFSKTHFHHITAVNESWKKWVEDNKLEPKYSIGDNVVFEMRGKEEFGEVARVYPDLLRYLIYCEHLGHIREGKGNGVHGFVINEEYVIDHVISE
jgi:hypothetical protein